MRREGLAGLVVGLVRCADQQQVGDRSQNRCDNEGVAQNEGRSEELTIADFFGYLVSDDDAARARQDYCEVVQTGLVEVASWLAFDAWLGGGDVEDTSASGRPDADPIRVRSFRAVGLVAQISGELVSGAQLLLHNQNEYGASALVRQLIECEYLLRVFALDFAEAARWLDANDSDRWDFKPNRLRKVGGFDGKEYADHCETGGHPHPKARLLLEMSRAIESLERAAAGEPDSLDVPRALWFDFALHCDRTWRALTEVLLAEHARFGTVRADRIASVTEATAQWRASDLLAREAGPVLQALTADPPTPLSDLIDLP